MANSGPVPGKAKVIREGGLLAPSSDLGEGWLEIELHNLDSDAESFWVDEHIEMLGVHPERTGEVCTLSPHLALFISSIEPFLSDTLY